MKTFKINSFIVEFTCFLLKWPQIHHRAPTARKNCRGDAMAFVKSNTPFVDVVFV